MRRHVILGLAALLGAGLIGIARTATPSAPVPPAFAIPAAAAEPRLEENAERPQRRALRPRVSNASGTMSVALPEGWASFPLSDPTVRLAMRFLWGLPPSSAAFEPETLWVYDARSGSPLLDAETVSCEISANASASVTPSEMLDSFIEAATDPAGRAGRVQHVERIALGGEDGLRVRYLLSGGSTGSDLYGVEYFAVLHGRSLIATCGAASDEMRQAALNDMNAIIGSVAFSASDSLVEEVVEATAFTELPFRLDLPEGWVFASVADIKKGMDFYRDSNPEYATALQEIMATAPDPSDEFVAFDESSAEANITLGGNTLDIGDSDPDKILDQVVDDNVEQLSRLPGLQGRPVADRIALPAGETVRIRWRALIPDGSGGTNDIGSVGYAFVIGRTLYTFVFSSATFAISALEPEWETILASFRLE